MEEILQLFVNMNVLKQVNLKLFAKSINLKFLKSFAGIKFCGHQKNCKFTGTILTVGLKLKNYLQKFIFNKNNSRNFFWLIARIFHRKLILISFFNFFPRKCEHFFPQIVFNSKVAKTNFCTQTSAFSAFTPTNLHLSLK